MTLCAATGAGADSFGTGRRCANGVDPSLTRSCTGAGAAGTGTGNDGGASRTCSPSARSRCVSQKKVKPGIPNDCPPREMLNNNACASKDNNNAVVDRQCARCAVEAVIKCEPCAGPVNAVTDFTYSIIQTGWRPDEPARQAAGPRTPPLSPQGALEQWPTVCMLQCTVLLLVQQSAGEGALSDR